MGVKARVGDVFLIPLDSQQSAVGQVIREHNGELFCGIFDVLVSESSAVTDELNPSSLVLCANTLDAKLWHGDWPLVGNRRNNLGAFPTPIYKVDTLSKTVIVSFEDKRVRAASKDDAARLRYRTVVAPVRLEMATKAYFTRDAWDPKYEELLAGHYLETGMRRRFPRLPF